MGIRDRAPTPTFTFPYFFSFFFLFFFHLGPRGCGIYPPEPNFFYFFFLEFSELVVRVWDRILTTSLFFSLISLISLEVVGSIPIRLNQYFLFNSLSLAERLWVRISFLIFRITFSVKVTGSNTPYHIPLTYIIVLNFYMVRSRVRSSVTSLIFLHFFITC